MHLGVINQQFSVVRPSSTREFLRFVDRHEFSGRARRADVEQFVRNGISVCDGSHAEQKRRALANLLAYPDHSVYFPRLSMKKVVYGLVIRVLEPRRHRQESFGLCGPAAFAVMTAKSRPIEYVDIALRLMATGRLKYDNTLVNEQIRTFNPLGQIADADWLMLASMRNSDEAISDTMNVSRYGGTNTNEMFNWLKRAGYGTICCIPTLAILQTPGFVKNTIGSSLVTHYHPSKPRFLTRSNRRLVQPQRNLKTAARFIRNHWKVMLCVNEKLPNTVGDVDPIEKAVDVVRDAYELLNQPVSEEQLAMARQQAIEQLVGGAGPNHWVLAKSIDLRTPGKVRITCYTWGEKRRTAPIRRDIFFSIYGGFIAISPLDPARQGYIWL